jgi:hypothetical protein
VLGQIGGDQPAFAVRFQVFCQAGKKSAQHAAVRVIHGVFEGRARPRRHPGRTTACARRMKP